MLLFESLSRFVFNDQDFRWSRGTVLLTHSSESTVTPLALNVCYYPFSPASRLAFNLNLGHIFQVQAPGILEPVGGTVDETWGRTPERDEVCMSYGKLVRGVYESQQDM